MVEERLRDGKRIAQLLASEVEGLGGPLAGLSVTEANPDVEPTADGTLGYALVGDREQVAEVYVQPDRARIELLVGQSTGADAATREGLRVRPNAGEPSRTLVFVEDGAEVKRAVSVLASVASES
ncbi:MAG: hypothetical protein ACQETI_02040 [Halobacteriota archaeon]